jgi:hypothetical protein
MKKFIVVVVGIVIGAIILAAATHLVIRARSTTASGACIFNLALIKAAKEQWALEHHKTTNDTPTWTDILPYLGSGPAGQMPKCPSGGVYSVGRVGDPPTCSIGGPNHSLPDAK